MASDQQPIPALFRKLQRELGKLGAKPQPKTIHQFRTATRRLEAIVQELVPEQDRNLRKLMKQLGKLRRRAGRVRDMDVLIANLRNLKVSEDPVRKAEVLRGLADMRMRREQKLAASIDKETIRQIRKRLKRAQEVLHSPNDGEVMALSLRMFSDMTREHPEINERVLHQYRIRGKKVRYIAELAGKLPVAEQVVTELKRMQDAIGEWHDWLTLSETAEKMWTDGRPSALLAALKNITKAKYREAVAAVHQAKASLLPISERPVTAVPRRKPVTVRPVATAAIA